VAKNLELAEKALALYREDPGLTIDQLARELEIGHGEAVELVDEHSVDHDGKVTYAGPGGGGGWVTPE